VGLIPDEVIAEIRARADIVSVIGQHVQLKRAGRNWKGLCPFHGEKSPSFNVAPDKGFFYCFGCQKKGDVFTFVMELSGKSFIEAAETLAAQCGVTIPETAANPEVARVRGERTQMLAINKLATQFFAETLASPRGAPGRAYLDTRAIGAEQRAAFQLGYAPADWHALADFLKAKRADPELAVRLGLIARQPKAGGFYDRFRERVVCPIILPGSEVAGFSARLVGEAPKDSPVGAKYINSPESPVYKKSRLLFGLAQAREAMRVKGRAILVEGNFDVISMHQAGMTETVAPLGTALTADQVELLRRHGQRGRPVLRRRSRRPERHPGRPRADAGADVAVRIAWRPRGDGVRLEGQDPDSLLRAGVDVAAMIASARDGLTHYAMLLWDATKDSPTQRGDALSRTSRAWSGSSTTPTSSRSWPRTWVRCWASAPTSSPGRRAGPRQAGGRPQGGLAAGPWQHGPGPESPGPAPADRPPDRRPEGPPIPLPAHEIELLALVADHPTLLATPQANKAFSLLTDDRLRDMYSAARAGASLAVLAPDRLPPGRGRGDPRRKLRSVAQARSLLDAKVWELEIAAKKQRSLELDRQLADAKQRGDADAISRLVLEVMNLRKQVD
jgi:DNA primase